jgi:hypothetical protein
MAKNLQQLIAEAHKDVPEVHPYEVKNFQDGGEQEVKNIAKPVRVFRIKPAELFFSFSGTNDKEKESWQRADATFSRPPEEMFPR